MIEAETMYSVKEVAYFLQMPLRTVYKLIEEGKIQAYNFGSGEYRANWRVLGQDISEFIEKSKYNAYA